MYISYSGDFSSCLLWLSPRKLLSSQCNTLIETSSNITASSPKLTAIQTREQRIFFLFLFALLISMTMMFVCVVSIGTFVMAPSELGEPAGVCVALHWGADLAQWERGRGDRLRLERQQPQHERQERVIQCEWRKRGNHICWWFPLPNQKTQTVDQKLLEFYREKGCCCFSYWKKNNKLTLNKLWLSKNTIISKLVFPTTELR